ncbi:Epoxide hydrolase 1 [Fragariocoptes setiger]|uniref:microsomal epoxide hydrolase n=1 Tax=Fragariocoptes setiger TaxID=1670756 RepID=A0ABQ7S8I2_9ACAR|nr:Epoxide hydrolase 1 [Fragariocoptes setiger]
MVYIFVYILASALIALIVHRFLKSNSWLEPTVPDEFYIDGYFGAGDSRPDDASVATLENHQSLVTDECLKDLKRRLVMARLSEHKITNNNNNNSNSNIDLQWLGRPHHLQHTIDYWISEFDWRKQEKKLLTNADHYRVTLEGLQVHFIKIISANYERAHKSVGVLLCNGWPSCFVEYNNLLTLLRQDDGHDGDKLAYEAIVPSIPGFGYSEAPRRAGFNAIACARLFNKLMLCLGYRQYYVLGSDWGSLIGGYIASAWPERVLGFHTTTPCPWPPATLASVRYWARLLVAKLRPSLLLDNPSVEVKCLPSPRELIERLWNHSGQYHLQATQPQLVAPALNDSPAGLAAYILQEFGVDNRTSKAQLDALLSICMIYWTQENVDAAMHFHKECHSHLLPGSGSYQSLTVGEHVPCGVSTLEGDLLRQPISFLRAKYRRIVYVNHLEHRGRHLALENPTLFYEEMKRFIHTCENLDQNNNDNDQQQQSL